MITPNVNYPSPLHGSWIQLGLISYFF
jgi:hypothetical protein